MDFYVSYQQDRKNMSNNRHLISPKTPEVRENTAAKPHHTRLCRGRCGNRPDSQRDYDFKYKFIFNVYFNNVEIDLIRKGIMTIKFSSNEIFDGWWK